MRVLMVATYFPKPGNPLMGTWALSPARALARRGVEIDVVSPTPWIPRVATRLPGLGGLSSWAQCPPSHTWPDGVRAEYPRWLWYANQGRLHQQARANPYPQMRVGEATLRPPVAEMVRRHRPDVIYGHHASIGGYLALQMHRATGVPYAVIEHDHGEIAECRDFPRRREMYAEVLGGAAAVIAVAEPMKREIEELFPGVEVTVLHNAADLPDPGLRATPGPAELGDGPVVFSAAHLYRRKGMPVLVRAFAEVAAAHPAARLRIAGEGEDRAAVEAAVAEAGLGDRVTMLGRTSHERVLQEMAWADVFALIGWDEPHAIAHMEAMASGTAVLCANDGGIMDIFTDGVQGRAVPPRDVAATAAALDELLSDTAVRERMGRAGRELVERNHTWDAYGARLADVLGSAAATAPASRHRAAVQRPARRSVTTSRSP